MNVPRAALVVFVRLELWLEARSRGDGEWDVCMYECT
jgi:hypothetical protein